MKNKSQLEQAGFPLILFKEIKGILGISLLLTLFSSPSLGTPPDKDSVSSGERLSSEFEESLPPAMVLPPLPDLPPIPQDDNSLSAAAQIKISQFNFEGNTVFSEEQLREMTKAYLNRNISAEELQALKNIITAHYIEKGFINSGAIIPDQKVSDGQITIKIIEGKLFRVDVTGNKKLRTPYIQQRLEDSEGDALNINKLQERLQMLQQNPRFKRIQAELGPGVKLGEGILKLQIDEEDFNEFGFKFNNHRSPSVGAYRGEMSYQHRNVTGLFGDKMGWGDTLSARVGLTEGLKDWAVNYEFPFNRHGASLAFHVDRSDSDVVEAPFNQLDVESEADTYAVTLKYPVPQLKAPGQSLNLSVRMEKRTSKTFLLGRPFSFSPGVQNGESDLSVIRLVADYLKRDQISVFALRSSFNIGLDAFGSTIDSTADDHSIPDSQFFSWLGQFQYVHRLKFSFIPKALQNNSQFIFRTDAQLADQGLLPLEKLSIGGATTVRGYRENYLTRDNGLISSLELRISHDKWKYQISKLEPNPEDGRIEIVPFIDYGRAWNADDASKMDDDIFSVGIGARWTLNQKQQTQLQVYWGHALTDVPDPEDKDLQDDGIHFGITFSKTF